MIPNHDSEADGPRPSGPDAAPSVVEAIAALYLRASGGDAAAALHRVIADALADLREAERQERRCERLISRGYVRGALPPR